METVCYGSCWGNKPVLAELPSVEPSKKDQFAINAYFSKEFIKKTFLFSR
jgi:hypothetical protein